MAILARAQITLSSVVDVEAVFRYYLLQYSTLTKPSKPTTTPATAPSGWTDAEPSYTAGSTNSLYTVDGTLFSDGTFSWANVQLSSSYEAAKAAYNKAVAASNATSALTTRVTNAEASITQNAEAIALRATKTEVTEAVEAVEVGGTNLLVESGNFDTLNTWALNGGTSLEVSTEDGHSCIHAVGSISQKTSFYHLDWGSEYVYHAVCKFARAGNFYFNIPLHCWISAATLLDYIDSNGTARGETDWSAYELETGDEVNAIKAGVWYHIVGRFKTVDKLDGYNYVTFRPLFYGGSVYNEAEGDGEYWVRWVKLERGNKATDWTPAPEDTYTKVETDALLKVEADRITSTVSRVEGAEESISTLQQTVDGFEARVSDAAKTADDYLRFDADGLVVGDLTAEGLGKNVRIDEDSFDIRDGEDVLASFSHSETSPLGDASPSTNIQSTGTDGLNVVAPNGMVRMVSRSDDLANGSAVILAGKVFQAGVGNGTNASFGSGGYIFLDPMSLTLASPSIGFFALGGDDPVTSNTPFRVHSLSVFPSVQRNLSTAWGRVTCGNQKAKSGSLLSMSGGGILCSRAGKVMVTANVYTPGASGGSVQAAFATSNDQWSGGVNTTGAGDTLGFSLAPCIFEVAEGEIVYLYVANWTSAAGYVPSGNDATLMTAWYID